MATIVLFVGLLLILSGVLFLTVSYGVYPGVLIPYWFASALVISSGIIFMRKYKDFRVSIFVCGECNRTFMDELDLRRHYAREHVKKDSDENKK